MNGDGNFWNQVIVQNAPCVAAPRVLWKKNSVHTWGSRRMQATDQHTTLQVLKNHKTDRLPDTSQPKEQDYCTPWHKPT